MVMLLVRRIKEADKNPSIFHKRTRYEWILKVIYGHRPVNQIEPLIDPKLFVYYLVLCPISLAKSSEPIVAILLIGHSKIVTL